MPQLACWSRDEERHIEQILDQTTPSKPRDMRNKLTQATEIVLVSHVHNH